MSLWTNTAWASETRTRATGQRHSRHDAGQVEDLGRQVRHVAVEEDEEGLDHTRVRREAWGEGRQHSVHAAHHHSTQSHHEETHHAQKHVAHRHLARVRKLLEQMIQDLKETHTLRSHRNNHLLTHSQRSVKTTETLYYVGPVDGDHEHCMPAHIHTAFPGPKNTDAVSNQ